MISGALVATGCLGMVSAFSSKSRIVQICRKIGYQVIGTSINKGFANTTLLFFIEIFVSFYLSKNNSNS